MLQMLDDMGDKQWQLIVSISSTHTGLFHLHA